MSGSLRWLSIVLAAGAMTASTVNGQEKYTLDGADTWVESDPIDPATPAGRLAVARKALAAGQPERASYLASQWIERHKQDPLLAEAYLIRADAFMARKDYYQALFDYEYIVRVYSGSDVFVTALERELDVAKLFASGTKRKLWGMRLIDASDEAEELFIRIQERLPGSELAEEAGMRLGDFYFTRRKMDLAAEMYAIFIENFPRSEHVETARKRLIYAHLAAFKGPEFDATGLYAARAELRMLRVVDPVTAQQIGADALLTRIDESDAQKLLVTAGWYLRTDDPIAAELTIRRLVRKYPRSVAAAEAMRIIPALLEQLPESVLREGPDYATIRAGILGVPIAPDAAVLPGTPDSVGTAATPPPTAPLPRPEGHS